MTQIETIQQTPTALGLVVEPLNHSYAHLPIREAFDWQAVINSLKSVRALGDAPLFLVAFRSLLKADADTNTLAKHDKNAHEAAQESPSFIHYFGGTPTIAGAALSFCLWEDAQSAKATSRDARHALAATMISAYESCSIEKYDVHHSDGEVYLIPRD